MGMPSSEFAELYRSLSPAQQRAIAAQHPGMFGPKPAIPAITSSTTPAKVSATVLRLTVIIPVRLQTESNTNGHWAPKAARAKIQKLTVRQVLGGFSPLMRASLPLVVTLVKVGPGTKKMDSDNLPSSAKHVRDAVAEIVGVDDGRDDVVEYRYAQRRGPSHCVEITIEKKAALQEPRNG